MLRQLLDGATAAQVIVVSAPAGSGKTLLLADWVREGEGSETAWISLDADDNDPRRLLAAVVTSLLAVPSVSEDVRMQRLVADAARKRDRDVVEELAEVLDAHDPPVRIVLDDVHELSTHEVLHDLVRLIRRRRACGSCSPAGPTLRSRFPG